MGSYLPLTTLLLLYQTCFTCLENCATCSSPYYCTSCPYGYFFSGNNCFSCMVTGCSICVESMYNCSACFSGYTLSIITTSTPPFSSTTISCDISVQNVASTSLDGGTIAAIVCPIVAFFGVFFSCCCYCRYCKRSAP